MRKFDTVTVRSTFLALAMAVGGIGLPWSSAAVTFEIEATVLGTALDAQYDGVFEDLQDATLGSEFATVTMGRVLGNFESERRAILEFDISGLQQGSTLQSVQLVMDFVSGSNMKGAYFIYGYEGDGLLSFGDADHTEMLVTAQSGSVNRNVDVDVTDFVQGLVDDGVEWVGILGLEAVDEVNANFIAADGFPGRGPPILVFDVPEPAAGLLDATALLILATLGGWGRRSESH